MEAAFEALTVGESIPASEESKIAGEVSLGHQENISIQDKSRPIFGEASASGSVTPRAGRAAYRDEYSTPPARGREGG